MQSPWFFSKKNGTFRVPDLRMGWRRIICSSPGYLAPWTRFIKINSTKEINQIWLLTRRTKIAFKSALSREDFEQRRNAQWNVCIIRKMLTITLTWIIFVPNSTVAWFFQSNRIAFKYLSEFSSWNPLWYDSIYSILYI